MKKHLDIQESFLETVRITTSEIDVIASRIAARKLLDSGWEVVDFNNLVPFPPSLCHFAPDLFERYVRVGPAKFIRSTLAPFREKKRQNPRLLFFYGARLTVCYMEIPLDLSRLILKMLPKSGKFMPIDYLVHNPEGYLFIELKANKSRLSKKQLEVSNMIIDAGYKVSRLHVSLNINPRSLLQNYLKPVRD